MPPPTLRFRLREKTENLHRQLDAELEAQGLMGHRAGYVSILKRFLGLYRPLERQLVAITWAGSGIDASQRRKSLWLTFDLERLGVSQDAIAGLPDCQSLPKITTVAEGLGAFYVLEGATLGGKIISRHIQNALDITSDNGGRFFAAYGENSGLLWREFVAVLDQFGDDERAAETIERTAVATFASFMEWMRGPPSGAGARR